MVLTQRRWQSLGGQHGKGFDGLFEKVSFQTAFEGVCNCCHDEDDDDDVDDDDDDIAVAGCHLSVQSTVVWLQCSLC